MKGARAMPDATPSSYDKLMNQTRLESVLKGLQKTLDEYQGELDRWLSTLGSERDLATMRLRNKVKRAQGMIDSVTLVLQIEYGFDPNAKPEQEGGN